MNMSATSLVGIEAAIESDSLYKIFRALPVCRDLGDDDCMLLFSCFEVSRHQAGHTLYKANTPSDSTVRLLIKGEVTGLAIGQDRYIRMGSGDVFGLFSFLDENRQHSATLMAASDVTLLSINREYFNVIMLEDHELGLLLQRFMFNLLSTASLKLGNEYTPALGTAMEQRNA